MTLMGAVSVKAPGMGPLVFCLIKEETMEKYSIIAHRIAVREVNGNKLSPREVIEKHLEYAKNHDGNVLITIGNEKRSKGGRPKFPAKTRYKELSEAIFMVRDCSYAVRADILDIGAMGQEVKKGYHGPDEWEDEDRSEMGWYYITNLRPIAIKKGEFTCSGEKKLDLFNRMKYTAPMAYVKENEK